MLWFLAFLACGLPVPDAHLLDVNRHHPPRPVLNLTLAVSPQNLCQGDTLCVSVTVHNAADDKVRLNLQHPFDLRLVAPDGLQHVMELEYWSVREAGLEQGASKSFDFPLVVSNDPTPIIPMTEDGRPPLGTKVPVGILTGVN